MKFLEKDLEEIIFNSDRDKLTEKGLNLEGKLYRQLRIGNYGVADLVEISKVFVPSTNTFGSEHIFIIKVWELKKDKVSISAFFQAIRYAKGIKSFIKKRFNTECSIHIGLIGSKIDFNCDICYISDIFDKVSLHTYSYDVDGVKFKRENNYSLIKEGFKL